MKKVTTKTLGASKKASSPKQKFNVNDRVQIIATKEFGVVVDLPAKGRDVYSVLVDYRHRNGESDAGDRYPTSAQMELTQQELPLEPPPAQPDPASNLQAVITALKEAGFKFAAKKGTAEGWVHRDGRAALVSLDGGWTVAWPKDARRATGQTLAELEPLLDEAGTTIAEDIAAEVGKRAAPKQVAGMPGNVVRAVEMLGGCTRMQYDLSALAGDKKYGVRMRLLKALLKTERVLAKDVALKTFTETFYSAVGAAGDTVPQRRASFIERCKRIMLASATDEKAAKKAEKETIAKALRASVAERTVPGVILPVAKPKTNAQVSEELRKTREEFVALAAISEPIAAPRPDAEVIIRAEDVALLEDPGNGIVLMQVERANSQGAICVHNNGTRVAVGVVPPATLAKLRRINNVDLIAAANQLLNPIVPSVPVTPVAQRHLTAVLNCKELRPMTPEAVAAGKKFASPAAKKSAAKPAKKAATKKASGEPRGTRATFAEDTVFSFVRGTKADEKISGSNKRGQALLEFIKGKKRATQAEILKAVPKLTETSQSPEKIWAFYRPQLLSLGLVKTA